MSEQLWIVYDERAITMDTDEAAVLVACNSLREAWDFTRTTFGNGAIYEYDVKGQELVNECLVGWRFNGREWRA